MLDEAREQQELDEAFAASLAAWEDAERGLLEREQGLPKPKRPPGKVELMGRTAMEHVMRALATLRPGDTFEVLIALPFEYSYRVSLACSEHGWANTALLTCKLARKHSFPPGLEQPLAGWTRREIGVSTTFRASTRGSVSFIALKIPREPVV